MIHGIRGRDGSVPHHDVGKSRRSIVVTPLAGVMGQGGALTVMGFVRLG